MTKRTKNTYATALPKDDGKILDPDAVLEASPLAHPMAPEDCHPDQAIVTFGKRIKPPPAK